MKTPRRGIRATRGGETRKRELGQSVGEKTSRERGLSPSRVEVELMSLWSRHPASPLEALTSEFLLFVGVERIWSPTQRHLSINGNR